MIPGLGGTKIPENSPRCWSCKADLTPNVIRFAVRKWVPKYETIEDFNKKTRKWEERTEFQRMVPMGSIVSIKLDESGNPKSAKCEQLTISQEGRGASSLMPKFKKEWQEIENYLKDTNNPEEKRNALEKNKGKVYELLVAKNQGISPEEANTIAWRIGKASKPVAYSPSGKPCKICPGETTNFDQTCAEIQGALQALGEDPSDKGPWEYKVEEHNPNRKGPLKTKVQVWRYEDIRKVRKPEPERQRGTERVQMKPVPADDKIASRINRLCRLAILDETFDK